MTHRPTMIVLCHPLAVAATSIGILFGTAFPALADVAPQEPAPTHVATAEPAPAPVASQEPAPAPIASSEPAHHGLLAGAALWGGNISCNGSSCGGFRSAGGVSGQLGWSLTPRLSVLFDLW